MKKETKRQRMRRQFEHALSLSSRRQHWLKASNELLEKLAVDLSPEVCKTIEAALNKGDVAKMQQLIMQYS